MVGGPRTPAATPSPARRLARGPEPQAQPFPSSSPALRRPTRSTRPWQVSRTLTLTPTPMKVGTGRSARVPVDPNTSVVPSAPIRTVTPRLPRRELTLGATGSDGSEHRAITSIGSLSVEVSRGGSATRPSPSWDEDESRISGRPARWRPPLVPSSARSPHDPSRCRATSSGCGGALVAGIP